MARTVAMNGRWRVGVVVVGTVAVAAPGPIKIDSLVVVVVVVGSAGSVGIVSLVPSDILSLLVSDSFDRVSVVISDIVCSDLRPRFGASAGGRSRGKPSSGILFVSPG